jgi:hypothetical protein
MRKFSLIGILTFLGLFVYFYKTSGKFRKSITTAFLVVFILFSGPVESEAKEAYAFTPQQHTTQRNRNRDFFRGASKNNDPGKPNNNGSGGDNDDNDMPQYPKAESVQETENRVENIDEYIARMNEISDSESEEEQCEVVERITSVVSKDGSITKVSSSQVRDKGKHIPGFLSKKRLKGVFDAIKLKGLTYEERLGYLRNRDNLPDDVVFEAQEKIGELLSAKDTFRTPGFLGSQKIRGTVFINLRLNQFGFRDEGSNEYRTGGSMSDSKIRKVVTSDFHLFPTAGAND